MANAADIIVNLVAKTGRFERGMGKSATKMAKFRAATEKSIKVVGNLAKRFGALALAVGVLGFAKLTKDAIETNDALGKMATTLGIMPAQLRGLQVAAELSGVAQTAFSKGLVKVGKAVVDAANGLTTYQRIFDRLNLTTEELLRLAPDQQLLKIGERISQLESSTERVAAAYDLFGGRNVQMVNLLANSRSSIEKTIARVRELGASMSNFDVAQFEAAADQLTLFRVASEGIKNNLTIGVLPLITIISEKMQGVATDSERTEGSWTNTTRQLVRSVGALLGISRGILTTIRLVVVLGQRIVLSMLKPLAFMQDAIAKMAAIAPGITFDPAGQSLRNLVNLTEASIEGTDILIGSYGGVVAEMDKVVAAWDKAVERSAAASTIIANQRKTLATTNAELVAILEKRRLEAEAEKAALTRAAEVQALITGQMTQQEVLLEKIRQINLAIVNGEGDQNKLLEARRRLLEKVLAVSLAANDLTQLGVQAIRNIQDALAEFFSSASGGFKGMLRDFVTMLRRMVAQLLARKILLSFLGFLAKGTGGLASFAKSIIKGLPKKHSGGAVARNQPVITGGPGNEELFLPNSAGRIFPGSRLGGTSVSIHQTNIFENAGGLTADLIIPLMESNNMKLKAELLDELDRGAFA